MADKDETTSSPAVPPATPPADPPAVPPAPEAPVEVDPVSAAAKEVADATALLDAAKAKHAEEVKKATPPEPEPTPEVGKHVFVDLNAGGCYSMLEIASTPDLKGYDGSNPPRQIKVFGVSCEHVSDHASGVWEYRRM